MNKNIPDKYLYLVDIIERLSKDENLIMSEVLSDEDIINIRNIMKSIKTIKIITIKDENKRKRLVFKNNLKCKYVSISSRLERGNQCYNRNDYLNCAKIYESVIPYFDEPRSYIYAKIGISYFKLGKHYYDKAIDYLTMAQVKSKHEANSNYHFNELIRNIKRSSKYNGVKVLKK